MEDFKVEIVRKESKYKREENLFCSAHLNNNKNNNDKIKLIRKKKSFINKS